MMSKLGKKRRKEERSRATAREALEGKLSISEIAEVRKGSGLGRKFTH